MNVFVARQPILDRKRKTIAYELLFRDGLENAFPDLDGDTATLKLLGSTFGFMGIETIAAGKPAFINFSQKLIREKIPLFLPKDKIVIEILEDVKPDPPVIEAVGLFKRKGYTIALDDFVLRRELAPLIQKADIIKFDFRLSSGPEVAQMVTELSTDGKLSFLAEKIETYEEFEEARAMGCSLFQGYFFEKPKVLTRKSIPASHSAHLRLVSMAAKSELDFSELSRTIREDVAISYMLMKFINSAYYKRRHPIESVRDAISMLGENDIRRFIMMVAATGLAEGKPGEMLKTSMIKGYLCEHIGTLMETGFSGEELFTLGLFRTIDAMLEIPMVALLKDLPFSDRIKTALAGCNPRFNDLYSAVMGMLRGEWDQLRGFCQSSGIPRASFMECYQDAIQMADDFFRTGA